MERLTERQGCTGGARKGGIQQGVRRRIAVSDPGSNLKNDRLRDGDSWRGPGRSIGMDDWGGARRADPQHLRKREDALDDGGGHFRGARLASLQVRELFRERGVLLGITRLVRILAALLRGSGREAMLSMWPMACRHGSDKRLPAAEAEEHRPKPCGLHGREEQQADQETGLGDATRGHERHL